MKWNLQDNRLAVPHRSQGLNDTEEPSETTEEVPFLSRPGGCPDPILSAKQQAKV